MKPLIKILTILTLCLTSSFGVNYNYKLFDKLSDTYITDCYEEFKSEIYPYNNKFYYTLLGDNSRFYYTKSSRPIITGVAEDRRINVFNKKIKIANLCAIGEGIAGEIYDFSIEAPKLYNFEKSYKTCSGQNICSSSIVDSNRLFDNPSIGFSSVCGNTPPSFCSEPINETFYTSHTYTYFSYCPASSPYLDPKTSKCIACKEDEKFNPETGKCEQNRCKKDNLGSYKGAINLHGDSSFLYTPIDNSGSNEYPNCYDSSDGKTYCDNRYSCVINCQNGSVGIVSDEECSLYFSPSDDDDDKDSTKPQPDKPNPTNPNDPATPNPQPSPDTPKPQPDKPNPTNGGNGSDSPNPGNGGSDNGGNGSDSPNPGNGGSDNGGNGSGGISDNNNTTPGKNGGDNTSTETNKKGAKDGNSTNGSSGSDNSSGVNLGTIEDLLRQIEKNTQKDGNGTDLSGISDSLDELLNSDDYGFTGDSEYDGLLDELKDSIGDISKKGDSLIGDISKYKDDFKGSIDNLVKSVKNPLKGVNNNLTCSCLYSKTISLGFGYDAKIEFDICKFSCMINGVSYLVFFIIFFYIFLRIAIFFMLKVV